MLLLFKAMELQNRFAPLPQKLHIAFCVFATVFFIFCYLRYRRLSDILWMLICDITLILQFYGDKYTALTVGVCEIILFATTERKNRLRRPQNQKRSSQMKATAASLTICQTYKRRSAQREARS